MGHRSERLDQFLGMDVHIVFKDDRSITGKLEYVPEFDTFYGCRKPHMYYIGHLGFRKSHVKSIKLLNNYCERRKNR